MPNWTQREDALLQQRWLQDGARTLDIALELERSKSATSRRIAALGLRGEQGNVRLYNELQGGNASPALRPIELVVEAPSVAPPQQGSYTALHCSDIHVPHQDRRAVEVLLQVASDVDIAELVVQGDVFDFWQLSPHRPPPQRRLQPHQVDLQSVLAEGAELLAQLVLASGAERRYFLDGNHEWRWEKCIEEAYSVPRMRHLLQLPSVAEQLDLHSHTGVNSLGFTHFHYDDNVPLVLHDRLVVVHGDRANANVDTSYINRYGKSVIYGHDHRVSGGRSRRDLRGTDAAFGLGCLCDLNPHYDQFPNWSQGFALVHWSDDHRYFQVEPIRIHDGVAVRGGKVYRG